MTEPAASPPTTFAEKLRFVGPGVIFAAMAVGSGELLLTPRSGALYGYALAWVAIATLVFKAALTEGLARCTVATGDDVFQSFNKLPGPRNWASWLIITLFVLEAFGYGGIALLAGSAIRSLFPDVPMTTASIGVVLAIPVILASGSYTALERVIFVLGTVLIAGVVYCTFHVGVDTKALAKGLMPTVPDGSEQTIMGLMGWVGAGTTTLLYSSWVKEKIGRAESETTYRQWLSTVRLDYGLAYILILALSLCFLILGATKLHGIGRALSKDETMSTLSEMLGDIPYGRTVFLITAFFTLFSTVLAGVDGKSRALASIVSSMSDRFGSRISLYRITFATYLLMMAAAVLFGRPVVLITFVSASVSVSFAFLGYMLMYVDSTLPGYARGRWLWKTIVIVGSKLFLLITGIKIYQMLTTG